MPMSKATQTHYKQMRDKQSIGRAPDSEEANELVRHQKPKQLLQPFIKSPTTKGYSN